MASSAHGKKPERCEWTEDFDGNWDTACGDKHVFFDGTPAENHHRFCPYCGKPIKAVLYGEQ